MKLVTFLFLALLMASAASAQKGELVDVLVPSESVQAEAARMNAKAFKLLPRGMYEPAAEPSYKDDENPIGIRGGGAFYSFSAKSHSYNQIPEIGLDKGLSAGGFAGLSYGLMKDLGKISLESISIDQPEILFFATYKPRNLVAEIREEQNKRGDYKANGYSYKAHLQYTVGNTYALRAISYDKADTLVVFTIFQKLEDGSLEIVWKQLMSFPVPKPWYSTDAEMTEKMNAILSKESFVGIKGEVKDNIITLRGVPNDRIKNDLSRAFHNLRPVSVNYVAEIEP